MYPELNSFDLFVDDILNSDENLLKGELDLLLIQYLFNSLDLENIEEVNIETQNFIAA
tara:strand:- start:45783 stop:45956 length:174 start_codon:yes stop_codon:yes gene_type:complete